MILPTIDDLIGSIPSSLGSYAPVLAEIDQVVRSQQCSLATVAAAIEKDPDLTARLLRLGNSAFYGFSSRLATVNEAISLIGLQQVEDLILVSSLIDRFSGIRESWVDMPSFWRHSLACGIGAREIAMMRRMPYADRYFVAGLLHDVGRLLLLAMAPEACDRVFELYRREPMMLREAESKVLGFEHAETGAALLRRWQLPIHLVEAVGHHHSPAAAGRGRGEAAVVHFSDHLVNAMRLGTSGEQRVPPLQRSAWELLGLSTDVIPFLVSEIDSQIQVVEDVFLRDPKMTGSHECRI